MTEIVNNIQELKPNEFLLEVMGDKYEEFVKEGKIEVKSGEDVYELRNDGSIINRISGQQISIIPKIAGLPFPEILAIKYSWLKYGIINSKNVQLIHTNNSKIIKDRLTYNDLINYMEDKGWRINQIVLKENSTMISTYENGIKIESPSSTIITLKGYEQDPNRNGYRLWFKSYDNNKELDEKEPLQIIKLQSDNNYNILWKGFYEKLSISVTQSISINIGCPGGRTISLVNPQYFMWQNGIVLHDKEYIIIKPENKNVKIDRNHIKIYMEADIWTKNNKEISNK